MQILLKARRESDELSVFTVPPVSRENTQAASGRPEGRSWKLLFNKLRERPAIRNDWRLHVKLAKCGNISKIWEWVLEPQYEDCDSFSEGLAHVRVNGLFGSVGGKGSLAIEAKYQSAWSFSGGLAQVETADADGYPLFGYINSAGNYVWGPNPSSKFP